MAYISWYVCHYLAVVPLFTERKEEAPLFVRHLFLGPSVSFFRFSAPFGHLFSSKGEFGLTLASGFVHELCQYPYQMNFSAACQGVGDVLCLHQIGTHCSTNLVLGFNVLKKKINWLN